jgi:hypothetical protein
VHANTDIFNFSFSDVGWDTKGSTATSASHILAAFMAHAIISGNVTATMVGEDYIVT